MSWPWALEICASSWSLEEKWCTHSIPIDKYWDYIFLVGDIIGKYIIYQYTIEKILVQCFQLNFHFQLALFNSHLKQFENSFIITFNLMVWPKSIKMHDFLKTWEIRNAQVHVTNKFCRSAILQTCLRANLLIFSPSPSLVWMILLKSMVENRRRLMMLKGWYQTSSQR